MHLFNGREGLDEKGSWRRGTVAEIRMTEANFRAQDEEFHPAGKTAGGVFPTKFVLAKVVGQ